MSINSARKAWRTWSASVSFSSRTFFLSASSKKWVASTPASDTSSADSSSSYSSSPILAPMNSVVRLLEVLDKPLLRRANQERLASGDGAAAARISSALAGAGVSVAAGAGTGVGAAAGAVSLATTGSGWGFFLKKLNIGCWADSSNVAAVSDEGAFPWFPGGKSAMNKVQLASLMPGYCRPGRPWPAPAFYQSTANEIEDHRNPVDRFVIWLPGRPGARRSGPVRTFRCLGVHAQKRHESDCERRSSRADGCANGLVQGRLH